MTELEKLTLLKVMVGESGNDSALASYLSLAKAKIISRAYPFSHGDETMPPRYGYLQCEIAAYMWNKRGAEGQTSHSENGISRNYENGDVPESLLSNIVPMCGVFGEDEDEVLGS